MRGILPVLRQNLGRQQIVDLSALIRRESRLDDHPLAPRASTPPVPLRRPPPARGREPCPAAAAGRVQKNDARPKLRTTDRLFWIGLARLWAGWRRAAWNRAAPLAATNSVQGHCLVRKW